MNLLATIATPTNLLIAVAGVLLAFLALRLSKKTSSVPKKVFLIYVHIALLLVPVAAIAYTSGCAMISCTTQTLLFAAPFIIAGIIVSTGVLGYLLLPRLYRRRFGALPFNNKSLKNAVARHARNSGIRAPTINVIDTAAPIAFSFRSWNSSIFISVGMLDILTRKEVEAVLLHELGHIVRKSSWLTFASRFARMVSPVAFFSPLTVVQDEELNADNFAIKIQKTSEFISSARDKIDIV